MVIEPGEKVHVVERRLFDTDVRRHFFGEVTAVENGVMRVRGYLFVYDPGTAGYVRSVELRTRLIPLSMTGFVVNVAPRDIDPSAVDYTIDDNGHLVVTDGASWTLDINEFGRNR